MLDDPRYKGDVLNVEEDNTLNIEFRLQEINCSQAAAEKTVQVRRILTDSHGDGNLYCQFLSTENGDCSATSRCSCAGQAGHRVYGVTYVVPRHHNVTLRWSVDGQKLREIRLNVTYPPRVANLKIQSNDHTQPEVFSPGDAVNVTCAFDKGNPAEWPVLLDRDGRELTGDIHSSEQIRYRFASVGCQDSGLIRCQTSGANDSKTARLLVKCPVELVINTASSYYTVKKGEDVILALHARSHTTRIETRLQKAPGDDTSLRFFSSVSGDPPYLNVTVLLTNVEPPDEGSWTLELSNEAGAGRTHFRLHVFVAEEDFGAIILPAGVVIAVGTILVLSVAAIVIIVITIVCFRAKRGSNAEVEEKAHAARGDQAADDIFYVTVQSPSMGVHVYDVACEMAEHDTTDVNGTDRKAQASVQDGGTHYLTPWSLPIRYRDTQSFGAGNLLRATAARNISSSHETIRKSVCDSDSSIAPLSVHSTPGSSLRSATRRRDPQECEDTSFTDHSLSSPQHEHGDEIRYINPLALSAVGVLHSSRGAVRKGFEPIKMPARNEPEESVVMYELNVPPKPCGSPRKPGAYLSPKACDESDNSD